MYTPSRILNSTPLLLFLRHGRAAHVMVLHSFQVVCIEAMLRGTALSLLFLHSIRHATRPPLIIIFVLASFLVIVKRSSAASLLHYYH